MTRDLTLCFARNCTANGWVNRVHPRHISLVAYEGYLRSSVGLTLSTDEARKLADELRRLADVSDAVAAAAETRTAA